MDDDDTFLGGERIDPKLDMNSTDFNAKDYLATKHVSTKYSGLLQELQTLKRSTSDKTEQLKSLVAEEIRTHEADSELLTTAYQKLKSNTDTTLSLMLVRCEEQRKIQHAMAVLHRFRSMFEIPARLRDFLHKKDYVKLVEEFTQLKANVAKSNLTDLLKPVYDAAHRTAVQANTELLLQIETPALSSATYKQAIQALELLGLVAKPSLVCVKSQLSGVEKRLAVCSAAAAAPPTDASKQAKLKLKPATMASNVALTSPTEIVQACAGVLDTFAHGLWHLVCDTMRSKELTAAEQETLHTTVFYALSTAVKQLETHGTAVVSSSDASGDVVTALHPVFLGFDALKPCPDSVLNTKVQALKQRFSVHLRQDMLLASFAKRTHATHAAWMQLLDTHQAEWSAATTVASPPTTWRGLAKSTTPAAAWLSLMDTWWRDVQPVLAMGTDANTSATEDVHATVFCAALLDGLATECLAPLVCLFVDTVERAFGIDDHATAMTRGPLVALANALDAHAALVQRLPTWLPHQPKHTDEVLAPLDGMTTHCFDAFMAPRLAHLDVVLATEEDTPMKATARRDDDDDNNDDGAVDESRQYVFAVLLLLVTWRHEIEQSVGASAATYVDQMLGKCVDRISQFLEGRVAAESTNVWCLTHLHVELLFFASHLKRWMPKGKDETVVKRLLDGKTKRDAVHALTGQLELQTQMYRLCLSTT
ncbi:Aste57867_9111 [Aphanomyces stellatus]|uniref:Exocyst complex component n=1 Tax=Aphanomyces stellatus TaxID=120398 RepID=A0A485KLZ4_9STRA|nr:hypothetical protein As57867_009075 [Aphanomyces stellatus]VFT85995.1 Aste57867_9111 [Aphanomyces stellatus]